MMNYEFRMNEREIDAARKWTSEHLCAAKRWRFWEAKGIEVYPHFTYSFTPAGIGDVVIISCHCGAKCNVTDYGSW